MANGVTVYDDLITQWSPKELFIKIQTRTVVKLLLFLFEYLWISLYINEDPHVRVFIFIMWYKAEPAWTHALEDSHE